MPRKSIVVVDVIWEFRMPKQYQISTEVARGREVVLYQPMCQKSKQNRFNQKQMVASV